MEKSSFNMKFSVLLLIASAMILISMAPGTEGQINLPCNTNEDCMGIDCHGGTPVCHLDTHQCGCDGVVFGTKISCSTNAECNKKCDPKCNVHSCVNGQCNCGCAA